MATVQELKDALVSEQTKAAELADKSLTAIDTVLNLATFTLGALGFLVAAIAIFGYALIANSSKKAAQKVATSAVDSYIKSQPFAEMIELRVRQEVKDRLKDKIILANLKEDTAPGEPDAFPRVGEGK